MIDPITAYPIPPIKGPKAEASAAIETTAGSACAVGYQGPVQMEMHLGGAIPAAPRDWASLYASDPLAGRRSVSGAGRPLRVAHLGPVLNRGGAEQWLIELVRFLDPARLRVERAVAAWPGTVDPRFVASLPVPHGEGPEAARQAAADCDVLLCWGVEADSLLGGVRPPLTLFLAHGDGPYTQTLLEGSARSVDHVVAVSRRVARLCAGVGLPTTTIYNGIDTTRLARTRSRDEARAALGFAPGDFVVGYVGRLAPEKRIALILEAVASLPAHVKVLMVGWGPLLPELRALAESRLPGRCVFTTAHDHLGDYYGSLDALCLLGIEEGFSLAMLEAMHCRCPLIATPVGAVPELIVDRINGLVVAPTADAVREAVGRLHDYPRWARGLAEEAHAWADRHGHAARMARDYEDLIERLWAGRSSASGHAAALWNDEAHPSAVLLAK